ncbi:MAG: hypothetical protein RR101_05125 [Burkholderiaceae bacterium]
MSPEHVVSGDLIWRRESAQAPDELRLGRHFTLEFSGKPAIESDDAFHNPEALMVAWQPRGVVRDIAQIHAALAAHAKAQAHCFMSNSINVEMKVDPTVVAS